MPNTQGSCPEISLKVIILWQFFFSKRCMTPQWGYQINPQHIYLMKKCSNTWISSDKHYETLIENCMFRIKVTDLVILPYFDWPQNVLATPNEFPIPPKNQVSSMLRTKVTNLAILPYFDWTQMATWTLRPIGGIWKLSQSISHTQNPRDRHQN